MIEVLGMKWASRKISDYDPGHGKIVKYNYHSGIEKKTTRKIQTIIS